MAYKGQLDFESFSINDAYTRGRQHEIDDDDEIAAVKEEDPSLVKNFTLEMIHVPNDTTTASGEILFAKVQNGVVVTVVVEWKVWVMDQALQVPKHPFSVDLHQRGRSDTDELYKLFVDPLGRHIIVATSGGDAHYVSVVQGTTFRINKPKDAPALCVYESVAWDKSNTSELNTSNVLVGSRMGCIYELRVDAKTKSSTIELVYQMKTDSSVIGLEVEKFHDQTRKHVVLATTTTRIYQFMGEGSYDSFFGNFASGDTQYQEFPEPANQPPIRSTLVVYHRAVTNLVAHSFTWLTFAGLMHGTLDLTRNALEQENVLHIAPTITLCRQSKEKSWDMKGHFPIGIVISEFHFYLLFEDNFVVLCHPAGLPWKSTTEPKTDLKPHDLTNRTVFSTNFAGHKKDLGRGVIFDSLKQKVYVYTGTRLMELIVENESRHAWRLYLDRALDSSEHGENRESFFHSALRLCESDSEKADAVRISLGDFYFSKKRYTEAVRLYSETDKSFEETVTKLMVRDHFQSTKDKDAKEVLLEYVLARVEFMKKRRATLTQERKQFMCLCTWIVEMYLERITRFDVSATGENERERSEKLAMARADLNNFLKVNKDMLDYETTLQLFMTHGRSSEMITYCQEVNNYVKVVEYHMNSNETGKALDVMSQRCTMQNDEKLWYLYSPRLIVLLPRKLMEGGWMGSAQNILKPRKLIPALTKYRIERNEAMEDGNPDTQNWAVKYLQWVIRRSSSSDDPVIHNMLVALHAQQQDSKPLEAFLATSDCYDQKYALRLCLEAQKLRACVLVYSRMKLYEDAVSLALRVRDVSLAKEHANRPEDDHQKKKLWIMIAEYVIKEEKNAKNALDLIKESAVIKVEDVLPYFSDNVLIQEFKTEICKSLDDYAEEIKKLKSDMERATNSANEIRNDIKDNGHRFGFISSSEKCNVCSQALLSRGTIGFYIFPSCKHVFHKTCLIATVRPCLPRDKQERVTILTTRLEYLREKRSDEHELKETKRELDDIVAASCILCGPFMVEEIDKPFIEALDTSWE